ncbi:peptidase U32 [Methanospirillum hungatei JF-1]|uniref:Peptidase U32 n=1 Tax=Methanospirillum hungatei JF-1 (strain ATCC 27890 / DSM 864 / NBRC 100397 / JF-1) TaxID=323259 RepID=Q2FPH8_METHJ|nr:U32 family peptidase [Methanospirillum hungatei]ABD40778.1 peptidase U32 [Methanospirillum hungatei JF-1]
MTIHLPLLLAPAGSPEALIAACAAGADAVYLGGREFGARQFASNFSDDELKDAVRYAHLRGIEVYVTVNTLITEQEMERALSYLLFLFSIGVDAVLIQDIGLLSYARQFIPDLILHASTQMGVHNIPGARYAAKNGCRRVVLARELTGEEIEEISEALSEYTVDLEEFAHGALCYAYSGRCLLSSLVGGRSGNRGMCAQPCRKQYRMMEGPLDQYGRVNAAREIGKSGYLLSTKDLSLYPFLDKIVKLPIAALKIEGRMRSPAYVATVTSIYRKALDAIRTESFHPDPEDIADLSIAFSRGFTSGYINGSDYSQVMGRDYPGNQGYYLGSVISSDNRKIRVKPVSDITLRQGDGLVFRNEHFMEGLVLRDDPVFRDGFIELKAPFVPKAGVCCYITGRRELERKISALLAQPDERYAGSLTISCSLLFSPEGIIFGNGVVYDRREHAYQFEFIGPDIVEPAKTRSLTPDQIRKQLMKTGGTVFTFDDIKISGEEGWFAPVRVLNRLRREILEAAEDIIIQSHLPKPEIVYNIRNVIGDHVSSDNNGNQKPAIERSNLIVLVSSIPDANTALNHGADRVYLDWQDFPDKMCGLSDHARKIGIVVPGVIRQKDLALFLTHLKKFASFGIRHFLVDSVGIGEYILECNPDCSVSSYYGLPVTNTASITSCDRYEFCTLSPELSEQEISDICQVYRKKTGPSIALCCQGLIEAAVTEDHICAYAHKQKGTGLVLQDEKEYSFPVWCEQSGRSHIMNSSEHSLISEYPVLYQMGIRWFIIDARGRGVTYSGEMTRLWRRRMMPDISEEEVHQLRDTIISMSWGGITRSGYRRGLCSVKP